MNSSPTSAADGTQFDQQIDASGQKFSGLQRAIGAGVRTMATAFTVTAAGATGLGTSASKIGKDFNVLQQISRSALKTILGSAETAADQMDRLDDFASNSPFARQVWITAQQQFLGFGVEAERVVPILDAVQQSVGGSNEQIESITYALAQMQGTGRIDWARDGVQFLGTAAIGWITRAVLVRIHDRRRRPSGC